MDDLQSYYAQRALEYDKVYQKPERQNDLRQLGRYVRQLYAGKHVLEIACGTGYWTQVMAQVAAHITATDINPEVLDVARGKEYMNAVDFQLLDMNQLPTETPQVDELFGGFIWSHIALENLPKWITSLRNHVGTNARLTFIDNNYVEDSSLAIHHTDEHGNTYQQRQLEDGTRFQIIKNFPTDEQFYALAQQLGLQVLLVRFPYYWVLHVMPG